MRILQALDRFLTQLEADGRSAHTVNQYRRHVRPLSASLGPRCEIRTVDHEDLARFLASPVGRARALGGTRKASTMNAVRSSLKGFFGYLHRAGYVAADPGRLIRRAMTGPPPIKTLTEDEQRRLLEVLAAAEDEPGRRDHTLFHLMLATGIRIGSALGLDVGDVDLERGEISLRRMKGGREDRVYLGREVREHLRRFLAGRTTGPMFMARGRRVSARHVQRRFAEWLQRAGITRSASPHAMRHTFATRLYARTKDLLLVQAALRHRSITSTMVYARIDDRRVREALEA